ncbi:DUF1127 domain-containing protein [Roseobacter weihaiensis]|uniref:DUF1127 domain-containing protein n=1 Tax=Roseobacter weihaiensis TaxID=2763262 RepID=UPI001D0AC429|nr:DUF1127 domain-containing protein [Roseobacter sp. H9]
MAYTAHTPHPISAPGLILRGLRWVWNGLIFLGENSARARVVHQISEMSDAELALRGLTRADLVKRMLTDGYHL